MVQIVGNRLEIKVLHPGDSVKDPLFPNFVVFYSFKGGVGRTLALVNVALLLAKHGRRVLVIDADLEAPGIGRIKPFSSVSEDKPGFLDLLLDVISRLELNGGLKQADRTPDRNSNLAIKDYYYKVKRPHGLGEHRSGSLNFMPSGKKTDDYASRVESLRIGRLYKDGIGRILFRDLRKVIALEPFDYILIDSRTGWSDIGGMCTRDLAQTVVVFSGLNSQNIRGTKEVLSSIKSVHDGEPELAVILVASPVPQSEEDLKDARIKEFTNHLGGKPDVLIPYHPMLSLDDSPFIGRFDDQEVSRKYRAICSKLLKYSNDDTQAWLARAITHLNTGHRQNSEKAFYVAADLDSSFILSYLHGIRDVFPQAEGQFYEDRKLIHKIITRIQPDSSEEYVKYGIYLSGLGEKIRASSPKRKIFEESVMMLAEALKIKSDDFEVFCTWGRVLFELGILTGEKHYFEDSIKKCKAALEINPDNNVVLKNLGVSLVYLGKQTGKSEYFEEAFTKFEAALKIKPDYFEVFNNWGGALLELGKLTGRTEVLKAAREKLQAGEAKRKNSAAYNMACVEALLENRKVALEWVKKALNHDPSVISNIQTDEDLKNLHELPEMKNILLQQSNSEKPS